MTMTKGGGAMDRRFVDRDKLQAELEWIQQSLETMDHPKIIQDALRHRMDLIQYVLMRLEKGEEDEE
jgi:hypothetical protein